MPRCEIFSVKHNLRPRITGWHALRESVFAAWQDVSPRLYKHLTWWIYRCLQEKWHKLFGPRNGTLGFRVLCSALPLTVDALPNSIEYTTPNSQIEFPPPMKLRELGAKYAVEDSCHTYRKRVGEDHYIQSIVGSAPFQIHPRHQGHRI